MRIYFIFIVILLTVGSCIKPEHETTLMAPTFSFDWGDRDWNTPKNSYVFNIRQNTTAGMNIDLTRLTGDPRNFQIQCYVSDLPNGITASPDTMKFQLNYYSNILFSAGNVDTGLYSANLAVHTDLYGTQNYPFKIHVVTQ